MTNADDIHRLTFDCEQHAVNVLATPKESASQLLTPLDDFVGFGPLIGIVSQCPPQSGKRFAG